MSEPKTVDFAGLFWASAPSRSQSSLVAEAATPRGRSTRPSARAAPCWPTSATEARRLRSNRTGRSSSPTGPPLPALSLPALSPSRSPDSRRMGAWTRPSETAGKVRRRSSSSPEDASAVAIQRDGKIVVAGTSARDFDVARYTSNGTPDTSFGTAGQVRTRHRLGEQRRGQRRRHPAGREDDRRCRKQRRRVRNRARYTRGGELDPSFGTDGKVLTHFQPSSHDAASAVVLEPDGKIVVAGASATRKPHWYGLHSIFALALYTRSGALDTSFGSGGKVLDRFHYVIRLAEIRCKHHPELCRDPAGREDRHRRHRHRRRRVCALHGQAGHSTRPFWKGRPSPDRVPWNSSADAIAGQPDGKFVVGGSTPNEFLVARYSANGTRDTSFGTRGTVRDRLRRRGYSSCVRGRDPAGREDRSGRHRQQPGVIPRPLPPPDLTGARRYSQTRWASSASRSCSSPAAARISTSGRARSTRSSHAFSARSVSTRMGARRGRVPLRPGRQPLHLDMLGGFGMYNVGRNNPRIRAALVEALRLGHAGDARVGDDAPAGLLAEELIGLAGGRIERCLFTQHWHGGGRGSPEARPRLATETHARRLVRPRLPRADARRTQRERQPRVHRALPAVAAGLRPRALR